ncbi:MAG: hypothetical protein J4432_03065 [DPANN group archaeon]|nr:hypothetical protein [DPANN group archaeon]
MGDIEGNSIDIDQGKKQADERYWEGRGKRRDMELERIDEALYANTKEFTNFAEEMGKSIDSFDDLSRWEIFGRSKLNQKKQELKEFEKKLSSMSRTTILNLDMVSTVNGLTLPNGDYSMDISANVQLLAAYNSQLAEQLRVCHDLLDLFSSKVNRYEVLLNTNLSLRVSTAAVVVAAYSVIF